MKKTREQISYNMSRIKNKDTEIELMLRRELWKRGIRYRKNVKNMMGRPDIAFKRKRLVVFCDSEFWHGYQWDTKKEEIKSNKAFWHKKIEKNIERDREVNLYYESIGWRVLRFWGDEIKKDCSRCADIIEKELKKNA